MKFYLPDPWNPTPIGEFRRVSLTTPDCEASLPDAIISEGDFAKNIIESQNTFIYSKKYTVMTKTDAEQFCKDKGTVKWPTLLLWRHFEP